MVSLNGQSYMELSFDYDSQSTQVIRSYDFTPSGGGESESSSSDGSSDGEDSSSSENPGEGAQ